MTEKTREELIDEAITAMNKKFGMKAVMHLGDKPLKADVIPTGSLALDVALGVGGIPRKRITEVYGPPSAGKTTLMQHLVAETQALGGKAVFIDMEHKIDPSYAAACGVNMDELIFSQPGSAEMAFTIAKKMIPLVDLIVIDSTADLVTNTEIDSDVGDQHFARLARFMSAEVKSHIKPDLVFSDCAFVFVNQIRTGIGKLGRTYWTQPGGKAVKFEASIRIELKRLEEKDEEFTALARTVKNNLATPFKKANIVIRYGMGIDKAADILEAGRKAGVVRLGGGYYFIGDKKITEEKGKIAATEALRENCEIAWQIREEVLRCLS